MTVESAEKLEKKMIRFFRSWTYVTSSFRDEFEKLSAAGAFEENSKSECIWRTRNKFVLKVITSSGDAVVYKTFNRIKRWRSYLFRLSPIGREAVNYDLFRNLGFCVPRLLAAGETRNFFRIKTGFLITEYAADTKNGLCFTPGKELEQETGLREEYLRKNLRLLAKLHVNRILHGGFTPGNLLWRKVDDSAEMELVWIDFASCKTVSRGTLKRKGVIDFFHLFRFFAFTDDEIRKWLDVYFAASEEFLWEKEELFALLKKALAQKLPLRRFMP